MKIKPSQVYLGAFVGFGILSYLIPERTGVIGACLVSLGFFAFALAAHVEGR